MGQTFVAAIRAAVVCALAPMLVGCAALYSADPFRQPADSFTLEVDNQHSTDATIYVIQDRPRNTRRVGSVGGLTSRIFDVPWNVVSQVWVRIAFEPEGDCELQSVVVRPGDQLKVEISPQSDGARCQRGPSR